MKSNVNLNLLNAADFKDVFTSLALKNVNNKEDILLLSESLVELQRIDKHRA